MEETRTYGAQPTQTSCEVHLKVVYVYKIFVHAFLFTKQTKNYLSVHYYLVSYE